MKIVEFTINIGEYDKPRTDIINVNDCELFRNNARNSRCIKILAHKYIDADYSIYYDANMMRSTHITKEEIIERYLADADICVTIRRRGRYNIYDEIESAKGRMIDKDEINILNNQAAHYRYIGIQDNTPVYGFQPLIRKHSPLMESFCEAWWAELCRWSYRDQIAFPIVLQKFPDLKIRNIQLGEIRTKLYRHSTTKSFPKIIPLTR